MTEGFLASWKRRVKRKLLYNFKHAYVDVLSRQQSAFNRAVLAALADLVESCTTMDHAIAESGARSPEPGATESGPARSALHAVCESLAQRLLASEERCGLLEERLARLEAQRLEPQAVIEEG